MHGEAYITQVKHSSSYLKKNRPYNEHERSLREKNLKNSKNIIK